MAVRKIYTGYLPRPHQETLHSKLKRFNIIVCHRRFGKTVFAVNETIDQALRCMKKNPQYAYLAPTYGQAKRVAWNMLKDFVKNIPGVYTHEQDLKVVIERPALGDKITIMLLGADSPGSLKGIYLDGCVLDEFAEMIPSVWGEAIRPALADRLGWAIFIGTVRGRNHFYEMYKWAEGRADAFRAMYKASETKILPESELEAARSTMSEEEYEQEFECDWGAALIGAYYAKYMNKAEEEGRIGKVPYDPSLAVSTFWDLGIGDTTAIWFVQVAGREYHIIDHLEMSGVGLEWYVKQLKEKDYIYEEHVLPHDAAARELGTGKARVDTLRDHGLTKLRILERSNVDDGIHAARMVLSKCWFDSQKCSKGLDALREYQKKWDEKAQIFSEKPLHNWASHTADAFRVFAMGIRDPSRRVDVAKLTRQSDAGYDIFNYSEER